MLDGTIRNYGFENVCLFFNRNYNTLEYSYTRNSRNFIALLWKNAKLLTFRELLNIV